MCLLTLVFVGFSSGGLINFSGLDSVIYIFLILLLGVPHGATDHNIFLQLNNNNTSSGPSHFMLRYAALMCGYAIVWFCSPTLALAFFLIISCFHFGQSHWHQIQEGSIWKTILYLSWGGFVLGSLLLFNYHETQPIIESIIGRAASLSEFVKVVIPSIFLSVCLASMVFLWWRKHLNWKSFLLEIACLVCIGVLAKTTDLLLGFTVFFVFWHSFLSVKDQIDQFRKLVPDYNLKTFIRQVAGFTIAAILSVGVVGYAVYDPIFSDLWIGRFFIVISIITLPHSILIDAFLEDNVIEHKYFQSVENQDTASSVQQEPFKATLNKKYSSYSSEKIN